MVELFCDRVADYRADVIRCLEAELTAQLNAAVRDARVVVPDGFVSRFRWDTGARVASVVIDRNSAGDRLDAAALDELDAVVTGASIGIAETGTIVLTHGATEGRRALTLVPDVHVCVVTTDQIVADVPDAMRLIDPSRPTTWISGHSATSDIEPNRVEGVHGPRTLRVLVVG